MEDKEKKNKTKQIVVLCICAIALVLASTLGTYAYFLTNAGRVEKQELTYTTGTLALIFEDNSDGINEVLTLGESVTKEFKIRNTGTLPVTTNMLFSDMTNTYMEGSLTYKLEYKTSETADWTDVETVDINVPQSFETSDENLAKNLTIPAGETYYYKLTITFNDLDKNQNEDIKAIFASKFKIGDLVREKGFIQRAVLAILNDKTVSGINEGNPEFANPATTDEGIFALEDDYGTSYYYRGAVENNYLKFGQNTSGEDVWWRIIRINGDGSVRIQYDGSGASGTTTYTRGFTHTGRAYNSSSNDNKYVGWMYSPSGTTASTSKEQAQTNTADSDIKKLVDVWYKENIADKGLGNKVADVIFCNDRSTPGSSATGWSSDEGLGYGTNKTAYGTIARYGWSGTAGYDNPTPTFKCPQKNDAFTVDDEEKGNGSLTYPVGLITADEIVTAGSGKYATTNPSYYLVKGSWYRSLSPSYYNSYARAFLVASDGQLDSYSISNTSGSIAPVINLKPEYVKTMIGTGTITDPYRDAKSSI